MHLTACSSKSVFYLRCCPFLPSFAAWLAVKPCLLDKNFLLPSNALAGNLAWSGPPTSGCLVVESSKFCWWRLVVWSSYRSLSSSAAYGGHVVLCCYPSSASGCRRFHTTAEGFASCSMHNWAGLPDSESRRFRVRFPAKLRLRNATAQQ